MGGFSMSGGAPARIGKSTGLLASGKSSSSEDKWIAGATQNKGGLHKSLGVPQGQKIPKGKIAAAAKQGGKVGKQARPAKTLEGMGKK